MKFRVTFVFIIVSFFSFGQNCNQSILSEKLISQTGSTTDHVLTLRNPFRDSLVFVVIPNDGILLKEKRLNFILINDSVISISKDWQDAGHLQNFIFLEPDESFMIDLKTQGDFGLKLNYKYFLISKQDYLENQMVKTRERDRYREELRFIASHKYCEQTKEVVR